MADEPTLDVSHRLFAQFCDEYFPGSLAKAAEALGLDTSQVSRIRNGRRAVTAPIAAKVEQISAGRFPKEPLTWPELYPGAVVPPMQRPNV